PLINAIVSVMKPDPLENPNFKITDIACGTGGFLISSFEWWKGKNAKKISKLSNSEKKKIFGKTYYGQELVIRPRRMAQMNLFLHGIAPNIYLGDTIYNPLKKERYQCILTNPPFGNRGANQSPNRNDFKIKTSNKQLNFVQHVFSVLEDRGRAALVLPDNVLFEDKATELWKYLMSFCNVHTILRLPNGTFAPYAQGVKANVVFLQKGIPTSSVWIYDARSNVEGVNKTGRPLIGNHFKEFEELYGSDPNGGSKRHHQESKNGRFRKFALKDIKERNYNLDISWIEDNSNTSDYSKSSAEEILKDAIINVESILKDLKGVLTELKK
ncbi:MAG: HsdM family class I SAM-dependent methyltransferase, partial [Nitrososphaeraceae archaeon]